MPSTRDTSSASGSDTDGVTDQLDRYLDEHRDRFIEDLKAALRIPSVSAQPAHRDDVRRCAEHIAARLRAIGMTRAEVVATAGHPVVYAEWLGAPGRPTAILYGHYDVQPPEPLELWTTPPFEPVVRDGKLFARGAVDNKGQLYMHIGAIEAHLKVNGALPVNLRVIVEGEEECGSESLETFLRQRREQLSADVIVISDTGMLGPDQPSISYALRGILYTEIHVQGPAHDLHSGEFGGAVQNPGNALGVILAGLKDAEGRVTVPSFYDRVRPRAHDAARRPLGGVSPALRRGRIPARDDGRPRSQRRGGIRAHLHDLRAHRRLSGAGLQDRAAGARLGQGEHAPGARPGPGGDLPAL